MARARQKTKRLGYELVVKRARGWERVGSLFMSEGSALSYYNRYHPDSPEYRVRGIRVNVEPIKAPSGKGDI